MQQAVNLSEADVFCVYGIPDAAFSIEIHQWLQEKEDRFVLILEEDEKRLLNFFPFHPRIRASGRELDALKKVALEFVFLEFDYATRPGNSSKEEKDMLEAFSQLDFFQNETRLIASDFKERGLNLLRNTLTNTSYFQSAYDGKKLFGKFSNIPAVICGAGPSLEKEIPYLRALKEKVLLFAGGTALIGLSQYGISPHFGGMIDPHFPEKRFFSHPFPSIPSFFQARVHPTLLERMQGPLLKMPGSENDFFEKETFHGGWNVATFLTAIAYHLGCNPIILVGIDLLLEKEKSYVGNLERSEKNVLIHTEKGELTYKDWLFASKWLSDFAKMHPEVQWMNASSGLTIKGFEKKALGKLSFEKRFDISEYISKHIEQMPIGIVPGVSKEEVNASFVRVQKLCIEAIEVLEKVFPKDPEKNGDYVVLQCEIEMEIAYVQFLYPVWEIWKYLFMRHLSKEIPFAYGMGLHRLLFMKEVCNEARKI